MGREKILGAIVILFILSQILTAGVALGKIQGRAILLIFDGISLEDISQAHPPHIENLIRSGGIGLMNTRSARSGDGASGYLTIGSGALSDARGTIEAGLAFNGDRIYEGRPAAEIYGSQNPQKARAESVVVLAAPLLVRRNAEGDYGAKPGLLAETLKSADKRVSVVGNADFSSKHHREAALITMDSSGLVAEGQVERELLAQDPAKPFGLKTDYEKLLAASLKLLESSDLLIVELGDSSRVNAYADFLTEEAFAEQRRAALLEGDAFLGRLLRARRGENDLIMVLSPNPPRSFKELPGQLTPLIAAGPGIGHGLLTSPTTRRNGLVTNTDIAPTVLEHLGAPVPEDMSGRSIAIRHSDSPLRFLLRSEEKIMAAATQRKPILTVYVALVFMLLVLGALSLPLPLEAYLVRAIQFSLIWALAVPLALLLLPLLPASSLNLTALLAVSLSGLAAVLAWAATRHFLRTVGVIAGATVFLISADILFGAPLMKSSLLGYDPLIGARFYGLGNEYMGVLIGAALIGTTILLDSYSKDSRLLLPLTGISFLLLILLIGLPQLGANTGGTIAATAAFLLAFARLQGKKLTIKNTAIIAAVVLLVVSLFVVVDYFNSTSNQSHVGKAVSLIRKEGAKSALDIVQRKVATNLKLIQWTIWSKVFIVSLLIFAFVFARPIGVFKRITERYPNVTSGIYAVIAGSVVALIFNDSGVVAAATMIIFGVVALLHLVIERERGLV